MRSICNRRSAASAPAGACKRAREYKFITNAENALQRLRKGAFLLPKEVMIWMKQCATARRLSQDSRNNILQSTAREGVKKCTEEKTQNRTGGFAPIS